MSSAAAIISSIEQAKKEGIKEYFEENNAISVDSAIKLPDEIEIKVGKFDKFEIKRDYIRQHYSDFIKHNHEDDNYYLDQTAYIEFLEKQAHVVKYVLIGFTIFAILLFYIIWINI